MFVVADQQFRVALFESKFEVLGRVEKVVRDVDRAGHRNRRVDHDELDRRRKDRRDPVSLLDSAIYECRREAFRVREHLGIGDRRAALNKTFLGVFVGGLDQEVVQWDVRIGFERLRDIEYRVLREPRPLRVVGEIVREPSIPAQHPETDPNRTPGQCFLE